LRCACGGGWKRSAGETGKQMKGYYNWYKKKNLMEKEEKWIGHILRGESLPR